MWPPTDEASAAVLKAFGLFICLFVFYIFYNCDLKKTKKNSSLQIIVTDEHSKYEILLFPGHHLWCVTDRSFIIKQDLREGYLPTP